MLLKFLKFESSWPGVLPDVVERYPEELDGRAGLVVCIRVDEPTD